ncbi:hypothetical protein C2I33_08345 [Ralstonia solanacearum]|uniref:RcnB family protein n=1 Tax=Ralstonia solanacearum TaxID=305 RepID=UPI00031C8BF4|nr:RcnB family protein [Ralstonia solanacearum]MDC6177465.1 RcnB family protein [Ralstonia solanacearum]MDC6208748.1 RcnB family protein [Ralstonia solanacearum]MDC6240578.1 RcnB family protein [Ralstonia solanacearum]MDD7800692.1 RcnB family protein [Ralstonia solanacearum]TYZ55378.1 hypothetical protein C2I33_08345 [Ralstonia solanacearum]
MRKAKTVSCLLLAASALLPLAGHAQDRDRGDERGRPPMGRGDRDQGWDRRHGDEGRGPVDIDRRADRDRPGRWQKGERIPPEYRQRQYVVDDWRAYHLAPPPRGHHWVGVGGDYFLVAPSGIVLNVVIGG